MNTKFCNKCGETKPVFEFHKKSVSKDGFASNCKPCMKSMSKAWRIENAERVIEKCRLWKSENKERIANASKAWRNENTALHAARCSAWQQNNPKRASARQKKWRQKNPDKINAQSGKYRASKINATPSWADGTKIAWFYAESKRLTVDTGIVHHVDHAVPLKNNMVCGLHVHYNLQILPATDNLKKKNSFKV